MTLLKRLEKQQPLFADLHSNLGLALLALGKSRDALESFKKAIRLNPDTEKFWLNLAAAHERLAQYDDAAACLANAVQRSPASSEARQQQAAFQFRQGDIKAAAEGFKAAIDRAAPSAALENNLGSALLRLRHWQEAEDHLLKSHRLNPAAIDALNNLGELYFETNALHRAIDYYHQALARDKHNTSVMINLIKPLLALGQHPTVKQLCADVLAIDPNKAEAYYYLAITAAADNDFSAAEGHYRRCCSIDPAFIQARHNLAMLLFDMGQLAQAMDTCREAVALNDTLETSAQNLICLANYDPDMSTQELWRLHQAFADKYMRTARPATEPQPVSTGSRIKIGYLSSDFRSHSVAYFIEPIIQHHDRQSFEVTCYYNGSQHDATTERIHAHADHWRDISTLNDDELAARIKQDRIDILVDLNGHTNGNRLKALARKPAPIQVNYLGYPNTTGMSAFDYRITDSWCDPVGMSEAYYSEQLVRLDNAFFSYRPAKNSPAVSAPPVLSKGYITFGSFNPLSKLSDQVLTLFAQVLHAVPRSRLLLQTKVLSDTQVKQRMIDQFESLGIERDRLSLHGAESWQSYLEKHHHVDILLDSFPWNGHTVSCHALWMGVPLITLVGDRHAARMGATLVHNLGLPQLATPTRSDYVEAARVLAQDTDKLARLRRELRPLMKQRLVDNAIPLTRELERAYRTMLNNR